MQIFQQPYLRIESVLEEGVKPLLFSEGIDNKISNAPTRVKLPKQALSCGNFGRSTLSSKNCITCLMLGLVAGDECEQSKA